MLYIINFFADVCQIIFAIEASTIVIIAVRNFVLYPREVILYKF